MANRLAGENSPYLLQHVNNPVDWRPWGREALELARSEDRPIFLSIGYAACHWCHVMERESFEDPEIAARLNRSFVPIKVDREERPDIDEIYMNAVQLMTGQGGWPLNMFLTPDGRPFFGGTYFPPDDRHGRPGLATLLDRVAQDWNGRRSDLDRWADEMTGRLQQIAGGGVEGGGSRVGVGELSQAAAELIGRFDPVHGGFGGAPKFPPDGSCRFLLRESVRTGECIPLEAVERTLEQMALGGIYDHVGGGFARYSVDERWLVPHFEKMLYNQALLVPAYVEAWQMTRRPLFRRVVEETLDFVYREMTDDAGGFHSSLDADSEGTEGAFYVWTPEQIDEVLGPADGRWFRDLFDITADGNFEGRNIPNLLAGSLESRAAAKDEKETDWVARLAPMRRKLLAARELRPRPATDDKILTAWNGLMIGACARAHQALGRPADLAAARRAADFVLSNLLVEGRLRVSYRTGRAKLNAYLDDHAFLARGLIDLYEAGFDVRYLEGARMLARIIVDRFENPETGGFHFVSDDHESLLTRGHSLYDGALPSGAGVATELLLRLAAHTDDDAFRRSAERALVAYAPPVSRAPAAFSSFLSAAWPEAAASLEIALVGDPDDPAMRALLGAVREPYLPQRAIQLAATGADTSALPLLAGREAIDGKPTAYVCRNRTCDRPATDADTLRKQLTGV